jgi:hypothetical protein
MNTSALLRDDVRAQWESIQLPVVCALTQRILSTEKSVALAWITSSRQAKRGRWCWVCSESVPEASGSGVFAVCRGDGVSATSFEPEN